MLGSDAHSESVEIKLDTEMASDRGPSFSSSSESSHREEPRLASDPIEVAVPLSVTFSAVPPSSSNEVVSPGVPEAGSVPRSVATASSGVKAVKLAFEASSSSVSSLPEHEPAATFSGPHSGARQGCSGNGHRPRAL
ncbi:hypothetical protein F0562_032344 [Nyssa sinensis]|uniref:Uncharacterized protein n=1 Tax=Nyssa sinensis TaxID=561372 RepID=A0A5J5ATH1_9ASTE|nr:hypothetical protein F0562_032344 [Nyssa sinensis]